MVAIAVVLTAACSGPRLPAPNTALAVYDGHNRAVQVTVSSVAPPTAVILVSNTGARYQAPGLSMLSQPHVLYNPPPSIGFGLGGIGFSGCCGFGSGIGADVPVGRPTPAEVSDQYIVSALIAVPSDYAVNWTSYHVEIASAVQTMSISAPPT
jgi:hypothetical protein